MLPEAQAEARNRNTQNAENAQNAAHLCWGDRVLTIGYPAYAAGPPRVSHWSPSVGMAEAWRP